MHLGLVLDMVHAGYGDRTALTADGDSIDYARLAERSWAASARFLELGVPAVVYLGGNHAAYPLSLFGAAGAGVPFIPLNYRLGAEQLAAQIDAHPGAFVVYGTEPPAGADPARSAQCQEFAESLSGARVEPPPPQDPDLPCVLLYTSGTTAAPKAAVLRHRHLMSYLLGTVEFASADERQISLVSVPPYHIAGVANLLSNVYAGRRIIYLDRFDPELWLRTVRDHKVTQAMVIPTMLARVVAHLQGAGDADTPSLNALSYGGARMPTPVLRRAMELFPTTGFVNAYGLTETSSTIALLGPDDHRAAFTSEDPAVRARLGSVGRLLPGIELQVRDEAGEPLPAGELGLLFLRGEQISGEYAGVSVLDGDGWFSSRDRGRIDEDGYLFIEGRADDTIIRGGENIAPDEIEDVLLACDGVVDAVVVGLPDDEWGQRLAAVVVASERGSMSGDELREVVRTRLRSSKTPETIEFWPELPRTETGKLLRRQVVARLTG
ncbi:MAG: AMP-binding protein [Acidimicrobiales bacterium]|nr:AMP-binding protein [Acidimicrobiales bacterium]